MRLQEWRNPTDDLDPQLAAAPRSAPAMSAGPRGSRHRLRVAFQGEAGAFSEAAARSLLGRNFHPVLCPSFERLFAAVIGGGADYGVAPVENSLVGPVHRCCDLLAAGALTVVGETTLRIRHHLIGCRGAALDRIRSVESHPVALAQCEGFFAGHSGLRPSAVDDTAAAVRRVCAAGDPTRAAIGSARAARLYHGVVLLRDLQDHPANFTRFLLFQRQEERDAS